MDMRSVPAHSQGGPSTQAETHSSEETRQILQLFMHARRINAENEGLKSDALNLVQYLEKTRKKLRYSDTQRATLKETNRALKAELDDKDQSIRTLNAQLKEARQQVAKQIGEINALKDDLSDNVKRMELIKEILKDQLDTLSQAERQQLAFLNKPSLIRTHSNAYAARRGLVEEADTEESEGVDYDRTEDDITEDDDDLPHTRSGRVFRRSSSLAHRRSVSAHVLPSTKRSRVFNQIEEEILEGEAQVPVKKRSRDGNHTSTTSTEVTTTITFDSQKPSKAKVVIRRSMNRSMSESNLLEQEPRRPQHAANRPITTSTLDLRAPRAVDSWTRGRPIDSRPHRFEKLASFFKMTTCDFCNGSINFAAKPAVRCIDCNQHVHEACKRRLAVPCVPKSATPRTTPSRSRPQPPRLQEFCPPTAPMIPAPLIHCIVALEKKYLHAEGIYRIPGIKTQVIKVLNELRNSRAVPKLELQVVEVITGVIKAFLQELKDPLIPKTSREEFVRAAATDNEPALKTAIRELPQPNRDTLAYLILHLHKVAANAAINKMPACNLSRVLAPTVVGAHSASFSLASGHEDNNKSIVVMDALLRLDTDYWQQFLTYDGKSNGGTLGGTLSTTLASSATPRAQPLLSASRINRMPHPLDLSDPAAVDQSLLGPVSHISSSISPSKGIGGGPTPLIIRPGMTSGQPKKYFASPM